MKKNVKVEVRDLEGESYIIGREGHIHIDGPAVSRHHAEIKFIDGRIRLRDLGSTNGVHLLNGQRLVRFEEGYVKPQQSVVIGNKKCTIKKLLEVLGIYTDYSDDLGLTVKITPTK
jgi:pSer/pThr/pTyr-binding forkhead associated (FHA) protein